MQVLSSVLHAVLGDPLRDCGTALRTHTSLALDPDVFTMIIVTIPHCRGLIFGGIMPSHQPHALPLRVGTHLKCGPVCHRCV